MNPYIYETEKSFYNKEYCRYCCNEYSLHDINDIKKHLRCREDYINTLNYLLNEKNNEILRLKNYINNYDCDINVLGEKAIRYLRLRHTKKRRKINNRYKRFLISNSYKNIEKFSFDKIPENNIKEIIIKHNLDRIYPFLFKEIN